MAVNSIAQGAYDSETVLTSIPGFVEEANRHLHSDDINTIEYIRRRLEDYCFAVRGINETCVEHGCCVNVSSDLQVIYGRLCSLLVQFNDICASFEDDGDTVSVRFTCSRVHTNSSGRPRFDIPADLISNLHDIHGVWQTVARESGVSYRTVLRRRHEYGLPVENTVGPRESYSNISHDDLCDVVREVLAMVPDGGETFVIGALRGRGFRVQRWRVRNAIQTVDPISRLMRRTFCVARRTDNVPCPNALW